jgi:hypothetical protein
MKKIIFLLLFLVSFWANCQKIEALKISTLPLNADEFIGFDGFDNYFYLKNNVFYKKSSQIDTQYANFSLGNPSKVDLTNPLKMVLFYEKFNTVVLLDNQLNELQKINFSNQDNSIIATFSSLSSLNSIWLFDSVQQQLIRYDLQSNTTTNIGNPIQGLAKIIGTNFNYFYWIDAQNQLFSLSIFGDLKPYGKLIDGTNYQIVTDSLLIFEQNNELKLYDFVNQIEYKIEVVEKHFKNFYYKDQILSIFTNEQIINYKIQVP